MPIRTYTLPEMETEGTGAGSLSSPEETKNRPLPPRADAEETKRCPEEPSPSLNGIQT